jgi:ATP-dependent RNA helicase DDX1
MPELVKAISELGWSLPTSIQAEAIPLILGGGDLVAAAETGSGKTGAFAIPALQIIHEVRARRRSDTEKSDKPCLSNSDRDQEFLVAADGWEGSATGQKWAGGRATLGLHAGTGYYEVKIIAASGTARLGWATKSANLDLGKDANGFGYGGTGKKAHKAKFENYGEPFGVGDVVGAYVDFEQRVIGFTKNGVDLGTAYKIPPLLDLYDLYPTVALKDASVILNIGTQPFVWPESRFCSFLSLPPENSSLHPVRTAGRAPLVISRPTPNLLQFSNPRMSLPARLRPQSTA